MSWILRSIFKLLHKPKVGPQVLGRAILKVDKDRIKYWLTCDSNWLDRMKLLPNENLSVPVNLFKVGTTIEIKGYLE